MPVLVKVKEYREERGWSQEQLAEKSGVSRSTVSDVETGSHLPTIEVALRLAAALEAEVTDLFILLK